MSKKAILFLIIVSMLTFVGCQYRKVVKPPSPYDIYLTTQAPDATIDSTTMSTEAMTDAVTVTTAVPDTETSPETTETAADTYIEVEYIVEGGDVWTNPNLAPPKDETAIATETNSPETNTKETSQETTVLKETTAPQVPQTPIERPVRDDIDTTKPYAPICFMYHSVKEDPTTSLENLFLRPSEFESQVSTMINSGCSFLFADEFNYTATKSVVLTFDDGYEDNYTDMFPILKKYNAKATIFIITGYVNSPGYLSDWQIKEMAASGLVRFCSHTVTHPRLTSLSEDALRYELTVSKEYLKGLTGIEPKAICYPTGAISEFVAAISEEYYDFGYTTVSSSNTYGCDPMKIPRVRVTRGMGGASIAHYLK